MDNEMITDTIRVFVSESDDTDTKTYVDESLDAKPVKKGTRWLVTLAKPGKGSSGTYSADVLKETGPSALPAGTKSFWKHTADRDPRDMVGIYKDGAYWNEEDQELQALLTPFPRYASVLDEAGEHIGASIHVAAIKDRNNVVRELLYDRANTVDLVSFPGLEGSGLKYQVESLFAAAAAEGEVEKKEENVELEKAVEALTKTITELGTKFDTFVSESKAQAQGVADEAAVKSAVSAQVEEALTAYAETEKAIDSADILTVQKESLKARARKGEDVSDDLKAAVDFVVEAKKELIPAKPSARGNVVIVDEAKSSETPNFRVARWSR